MSRFICLGFLDSFDITLSIPIFEADCITASAIESFIAPDASITSPRSLIASKASIAPSEQNFKIPIPIFLNRSFFSLPLNKSTTSPILMLLETSLSASSSEASISIVFI